MTSKIRLKTHIKNIRHIVKTVEDVRKYGLENSLTEEMIERMIKYFNLVELETK